MSPKDLKKRHVKQAEYRARNKAEIRVRQAAWYLKNRVGILMRQAKYNVEHRENRLLRSRVYYANNRDKFLIYFAGYRARVRAEKRREMLKRGSKIDGSFQPSPNLKAERIPT